LTFNLKPIKFHVEQAGDDLSKFKNLQNQKRGKSLMKDIIQTQLTAADRTTIQSLIADLETAFSGKTATIDDSERSRYGSVNEQNKLVVNKARDYRTNQPAMSSPDVDWTEFESDYQARTFLENCISRLKALTYALESTKIMHDYDNFQDALRDYSYAQYKHGAGEEGYAAKVNEFKQFFAKSGKTKPPEPGGTP
jgi:hypothetical protein